MTRRVPARGMSAAPATPSARSNSRTLLDRDHRLVGEGLERA